MPRRLKRTATLLLHWMLLVPVVMLGGGTVTPTMEWLFALTSLAMCALALGFGLQAYAGPRSPVYVRAINTWGHRGLYVYLAFVGGGTLYGLLTGAGPDMIIHYQILLWITIFHAIYHFWRQLVIGDGALRTMMPRRIHHLL